MMKEFFKGKQLAAKIGIMISVLLTLVFILFIVIIAFGTASNLNRTITDEFEAVSAKNAVQVQAVFDAVEVAGNGVQSYMLREYEKSAVRAKAAAEAEAEEETEGSNEDSKEDSNEVIYISRLYEKEVTQASYEVENYLAENFRTISAGNDNVRSIGVMFEPYKYDDNIESFSVMSSSLVNDGEAYSYGEYEDYSSRLFYKMAKETEDVIITPITEYQGENIISIAYPIILEGDFKGVVTADISIAVFDEMITKNDRFKTMYSEIISDGGDIIYDTRGDGSGNIKDGISDGTYRKIESGMAGDQPFYLDVKRDGTKYTSFYSPINTEGIVWWTATNIASSEQNEPIVKLSILMIIMAVGAVVLIIFATVTVLRKTLTPIQAVVGAAESIASGDFAVNLDSDSEDEIGTLTNAFDRTANTLKEVVSDMSRVLDSVSQQNLDVTTDAEYVGELSQIEGSMKKIIVTLNLVLRDIGQAAVHVSSGSGQVAEGAQSLSEGAMAQAGAVEQLAATINDVSAQVRDMAVNAKAASERAARMGREMQESNIIVQDMMEAMEEVSKASAEIEDIVKTIESIAGQTNLLALNAAIEAARAGSAGKGFAVLADEVRNLANESAEASKNTSELIAHSLEAVRNGTMLANETAKAFLAAVQGAEEVVDTIDKISEASAVQAEAIEQITVGIEQISNVVQINSATAQESAATSEELSAQADTLRDLVGKFHLMDRTEAEHMS